MINWTDSAIFGIFLTKLSAAVKPERLMNWQCLDLILLSREGEWADPGGTAIPGQPAVQKEQAPY